MNKNFFHRYDDGLISSATRLVLSNLVQVPGTTITFKKNYRTGTYLQNLLRREKRREVRGRETAFLNSHPAPEETMNKKNSQ